MISELFFGDAKNNARDMDKLKDKSSRLEKSVKAAGEAIFSAVLDIPMLISVLIAYNINGLSSEFSAIKPRDYVGKPCFGKMLVDFLFQEYFEVFDRVNI